MSEEILDVFTENLQPVGTASREEVHRKGWWHQTVHIWIIRRDPDGNQILFQQRHPAKKAHPRMWDVSAAGHLTTGEQPQDGLRELEEELGIRAAYEDLIPLGTVREVLVPNPGVIDREHRHLFLYESDLPLEKYRVQPEEVSGLVQVQVSEVWRLFRGERDTVRAEGLLWDADGRPHAAKLMLAKKDFVPHSDGYYLKVLEVAADL